MKNIGLKVYQDNKKHDQEDGVSNDQQSTLLLETNYRLFSEKQKERLVLAIKVAIEKIVSTISENASESLTLRINHIVENDVKDEFQINNFTFVFNS